MLIDFRELHDWLIAKPEFPRLDARIAQDFASVMVERCSGSTQVILDLANVQFIDSRGLSALVSISKVLSTGGILRLANISDQVEILMTMTRLSTFFPIFGSVDEAIEGPPSRA